jgi:hypothetical protein
MAKRHENALDAIVAIVTTTNERTSMTRTFLAGAILLGCALPALAQSIKPGLWDLSSQFSSPDKQVQATMNAAQEHLAKMSPEQRAQMQQMLRQNGVQLDLGNNGAIRTKVCMTREMAERNEFPVQQGDCTQKFTRQAGGNGTLAFSCTKPKITGQGTVTRISDTSYRAQMRVTSAEQGKPQVVDTNVTGNWVGADCGGLKPLGSAAAK